MIFFLKIKIWRDTKSENKKRVPKVYSKIIRNKNVQWLLTYLPLKKINSKMVDIKINS